MAVKFGLRKDISFDTRITAARYDEPAIQIPGHEKFKGMFCHMARWPRDPVDFAGQRVGVVGNGSGGVQIIQSVAPLAGYLTVFQRTPT